MTGNCVTIEVGGSPSPLDELDIWPDTASPGPLSLDARPSRRASSPFPCKASDAVLPDDFAGVIDLELVGGRNGVPLGHGLAAITIPPVGQRVQVTMSPLDVNNPDLRIPPGADLSMLPGADLSVSSNT